LDLIYPNHVHDKGVGRRVFVHLVVLLEITFVYLQIVNDSFVREEEREKSRILKLTYAASLLKLYDSLSLICIFYVLDTSICLSSNLALVHL
jgi:hypothetical protein